MSEYWIETVSGKRFDFVDTMPSMFTIPDIATHLSNLCRFTGAVDRFVSVAEHCIHVSSLLPENLKLHGLLHDGSEAYMNDLSSPVKALCTEYKRIEKKIQSIIYQTFAGHVPSRDEAAMIKWADRTSMRSEAEQCRSVDCKHWPIFQEDAWPMSIEIQCWDSIAAKTRYIEAWANLQ